MKPINRLPQSPRKIVAGLKLKRKNPRIAPANAMVSNDTSDEPLKMATTKTTNVENRADPAAKPSDHPQNGNGQTNGPTELTCAEQDRQIENPKAAGEEKNGREHLNRELGVGTDRANVVVDAQGKNNSRGHQNGEQGLEGEGRYGLKKIPAGEQGNGDASEKGKKNCHATKAG
jgi:hypothetical protein